MSAKCQKRTYTTNGLNALGVAEHVIRVAARLDVLKAYQIGSPIGLAPILQLAIAVVYIRTSRNVGAHRGIQSPQLSQLRWGFVYIVPGKVVLHAAPGLP